MYVVGGGFAEAWKRRRKVVTQPVGKKIWLAGVIIFNARKKVSSTLSFKYLPSRRESISLF